MGPCRWLWWCTTPVEVSVAGVRLSGGPVSQPVPHFLGHQLLQLRGQAWVWGQPTHPPALQGLSAGATKTPQPLPQGPELSRVPKPLQLIRGGQNVSGREIWKQLLREPSFEQFPKRHQGRSFRSLVHGALMKQLRLGSSDFDLDGVIFTKTSRSDRYP